MQLTTFALAAVCCFAVYVLAEDGLHQPGPVPALESVNEQVGVDHVRDKRTLFLKKKLLGAGLLGFGVGLAKGYKFGSYSSQPEVRHVYLSPPPPPPVKYVEYVEKPVFVERIVEKPVHFERVVEKPIPVEYEPAWSQPAPSYGPW